MPYIQKSVRRKSFELYKKVIALRKKEFSYSEIRKETGLAKSTINNWLTYAGLTLTEQHLEIQSKKRQEAHIIATEASRVTRQKRKDLDIQNFISKNSHYFNNPFFLYSIALYESEGSKSTDCKFSNSDYRLMLVFVKFIEKYFFLNRSTNMTFSLYIHVSRKNDLNKIINFWCSKMGIQKDKMYIYWKKNKIVGRKENPEYVGQMSVRVKGESILGSKLQNISGIILKQYLRL